MRRKRRYLKRTVFVGIVKADLKPYTTLYFGRFSYFTLPK